MSSDARFTPRLRPFERVVVLDPRGGLHDLVAPTVRETRPRMPVRVGRSSLDALSPREGDPSALLMARVEGTAPEALDEVVASLTADPSGIVVLFARASPEGPLVRAGVFAVPLPSAA